MLPRLPAESGVVGVWYINNMDKHLELLDVVDEQDRVIGKATRDQVHKEGLLHREIHLWLYDKNGKVALERRSPKADMGANLLNASVGGHLDLGEAYEAAAIRELQEEIGIKATMDEIIPIIKMRSKTTDLATKKINNVFRQVFAYFLGELSVLKYNSEESAGFDYLPIEMLINLSNDQKGHFVQSLSQPIYIEVFKKIQQLVRNGITARP